MADSDTLAITHLINLYGLAVDTRQWDLLDQVFTPDADVDHGPGAHWPDLETMKRDYEVFHQPFASVQHAMMSHMVKVQGDRANAFCYGLWRLMSKDGESAWEGTGWYDDELVRIDGKWRIKSRRCRVVRSVGNPFGKDSPLAQQWQVKIAVLKQEADAGRVRFINALRSDCV